MATRLLVYFFRGSSAVTTQLKNAAFLIAQPKLKKPRHSGAAIPRFFDFIVQEDVLPPWDFVISCHPRVPLGKCPRHLGRFNL